MSQFSGRQTDSRGMTRNSAGRIDKDSHLQGTPKTGRSKGVMAIRREQKREEADERNAQTRDDRRAEYRPHRFPTS